MKHARKLIALLLTALLTLSLTITSAHSEDNWDVIRLNKHLNTLAEKTKDAWQKAIYLAGAENLTVEGDKLSFYLRGYAPDMKALPKLTVDPAGWYEGFFQGLQAHGLSAALQLKDGEPTKASQAKLEAAVRAAAGKAKGVFGQQTVKTAMLNLLFPSPYKDTAAVKSGQLTPAFKHWAARHGVPEGQWAQYAALLYAQQHAQLNTSGGPHAMAITVRWVAPEALLADGSSAALATLSKQTRANAQGEDALKGALDRALLDSAAKLRKTAKEKHTFAMDVDVWAWERSGEYTDLLAAFSMESAFDSFVDKVRALPDYPAQDYPKNGRISGNSSGTKINIRAPKDNLARYVQIRRASDDRMTVDLFIRPGGTASVRTPQGDSYLLIAAGTTWYGTEALFGEDSRLSRTADFEIMSSRYYHTLTLGQAEEGNLPIGWADQSMFQR